jgi:hypothetical protein
MRAVAMTKDTYDNSDQTPHDDHEQPAFLQRGHEPVEEYHG